MGIFFKRNRKQAVAPQKDSGTKSPGRTLQKGWADWMTKCTSNFKRRHWLIALALFIVVAGGYNFYLIAGAFFSKGATLFSISSIHKPKFFTETGEAAMDSVLGLPLGEYERVHRFRLYMDSLAQSPTGRKVYDSILMHRPGLMDSVWFIEKHYRASSTSPRQD